MQNVYITRNGKQIQLTVDEIKAAWAAWDAELREEQLDIYKEEVKRTLLKLSKENDKPEYEKAADNDDIVDEIARDIRRAIKMDVIMIGVLIPVSMEVLWIVIILR